MAAIASPPNHDSARIRILSPPDAGPDLLSSQPASVQTGKPPRRPGDHLRAQHPYPRYRPFVPQARRGCASIDREMAERIEIRIEDPGDSAEIEVVELRVTAGDRVRKGSVLLEVATDKANVDIEAPRDGVVEKLMVAKGDVVKVDRVLAVLLS
jgi:biotin carboxyl carrier protein